MLKLLKWEFIRRLKEQGIFYIVLVLLIGSLYILKDVDRTKELLPAISSVYGGSLFVLLNVFSIIYLIYSVRKSFHVTEKLSYCSIYKVLGAKLISNGIFFTITWYGIKLLERVLVLYNTANVTYLITKSPYHYVFQFCFILPCAILFLYLLTFCFSITKRFPIVSTIIILNIIILTIYLARLGTPIRQYLLFQHKSASYIINILVFSLLFYLCGKLYEKKFEVLV